eukprot:TRINITY_DN4007_c0_g1_i6.p1 TRINITY_DN4007_c0_g1~~TRINITY_DN4007_c0_g1_i6.p1  ORF type:complete len:159 (-),score=24.87 TRINITY_DN4007_c0_g1_i6:537-1013(-)
MHGREWSEGCDPTGWLMSEKLDGIRAFWDGSVLYSKQGRLLPVPRRFTMMLPRNVPLDGELWAGNDGFPKLLSILGSSSKLICHDQEEEAFKLWHDIKFCVFDAPTCPGSYSERHSFAQNNVQICGSSVHVIPFQPCLDSDHLFATLTEIIHRGGFFF